MIKNTVLLNNANIQYYKLQLTYMQLCLSPSNALFSYF